VIFLTVGTQFPFDRLVRAVDEAAGRGLLWEEVFAQIGAADYKPVNFKWVGELPKSEYAEMVSRASAIVGHAGMGTIVMALEAGKPLLVMPRLPEFGEIVNYHQVATGRKFAALGHVLMAKDEAEIAARLGELEEFKPKERVARGEKVVERVAGFLEALRTQRTPSPPTEAQRYRENRRP